MAKDFKLFSTYFQLILLEFNMLHFIINFHISLLKLLFKLPTNKDNADKINRYLLINGIE